MEHAAQLAEYVIARLSRFPLQSITAKRPWNADRVRHLPPDFQHLGVEKHVQNRSRRSIDHKAMSEFAHRPVGTYCIVP